MCESLGKFCTVICLERKWKQKSGKNIILLCSAYIEHYLLLQHRPFIQRLSSLKLALGAMFLTTSLQNPAWTVKDSILPEK